MNEIKEVLQQLKTGKTVDDYRIAPEVLNNMGKQSIEMLTEICNMV